MGKNERGVAGRMWKLYNFTLQRPLEGGPATMRDDILKLFNLQGYGLILYKLEVREEEVILE